MSEMTPKILLVDDDQDDHFFMKTVIKEFNPLIQVKSVYNGVQAVNFLAETKQDTFIPDVILTDLNMPIMNGIELLIELKKNPAYKEIPVFIISTSKNEKVEKECMDNGAVKYYLKPISTCDLKSIISEILLTAGIAL
jgi:CheY-like chemotaxis protein